MTWHRTMRAWSPLCQVGLAAWLAGCSGASAPDTFGGSGGSGGSAAAGESTQAGGDPTPSASGAGGAGTTSAEATGASTGEGPSGPGATGSTGAGGGEAPIGGPTGEVEIEVGHYSASTFFTWAVGWFDAAPQCDVIAQAGPCVLTRCSSDGALSDAGTLTLSGGDLPASLVGPGYDSGAIEGALVGAGDPITVTGPGSAQVPAFTLGATFPGDLHATAPSFAGGTVSSTSDLTFAWTSSGGAGDVLAVVQALEGEDLDRITCSAPVGDGQLVLGGSLLAQLVPGDVLLALYRRAANTSAAGDWTMKLSLLQEASADENIAGGAFEFYTLE